MCVPVNKWSRSDDCVCDSEGRAGEGKALLAEVSGKGLDGRRWTQCESLLWGCEYWAEDEGDGVLWAGGGGRVLSQSGDKLTWQGREGTGRERASRVIPGAAGQRGHRHGEGLPD